MTGLLARLASWLFAPLAALFRDLAADWRRDQALRELGRARGELDNMERANAKAAAAAAARAGVRAGDPAELREDDGYRRD